MALQLVERFSKSVRRRDPLEDTVVSTLLIPLITYSPPFIWGSFTELGLRNVDVAESLQGGTVRALVNIGYCLRRFVRFIRAAENCFAWCI